MEHKPDAMRVLYFSWRNFRVIKILKILTCLKCTEVSRTINLIKFKKVFNWINLPWSNGVSKNRMIIIFVDYALVG